MSLDGKQLNDASIENDKLIEVTQGFLYFPVWGEENNALGNNGLEYSFGAGDAPNNVNYGIPIPIDCELAFLCLSIDLPGTGTSLIVVRDGTNVFTSSLSPSSQANTIFDLSGAPVSFTAGELFNIRTGTAGGAGGGARFVAWFRYSVDAIKGDPGTNFNDQLFGSGVPSNGLGNNGDVYFDITNGDLYSKVAGSWGLQLNLTGPQGPAGLDGQDGVDGATFNDQLFGAGVPSNGLGNDGDIYFDTTNGDLYNKVTGAWVFQINLQGGGTVSINTIELTNTAQTTVNDSALGTDLNSINTTALVDTFASGVNVAVDEVEVLAAGLYEVYFNAYYTSVATRANVGIEFTINGVDQGIRSASAYLRNSGGHNESSTNLKQVFSLSVNDTIGVRFFQLAATGTVTLDAGNSLLSIKKIG